MDLDAIEQLLPKAYARIGEKVMDAADPTHLPTNEDIETIYALGHSFYQAGHIDKAEPLFRRLVGLAPLQYRAWYGLAATLQLKNSYKEAIVAWSMAALLDDKQAMPHYHAAECLQSISRSCDAVDALENALQRLSPHNQELREKINGMKGLWEESNGAA